MADKQIDRSTLEHQNREIDTERDIQKAFEDQDAEHALDINERPGLLDGAPFIPPVAYSGPMAGVGSMGGGGTGTGPVGLPLPVVPVVEGDHVDTGVLVNPFTPADPDNDRAFQADIPSSGDLAARVESEMASDGRLASSTISVTSDDGVITLTGTAPSPEAAANAADVASRIPGVQGVVNSVRSTESTT
jgi:hypothetical protein